MKILLTVISLCLGISFAYNLVCPDVSQWSIRARLLCPDPSKYYCLLDGNADVFIENCSKVDYTAPGKRLVIHYNFDAELCSKDVYQPFIHWTNESSGCTYKKSSCNEEGQVIYDDTITYEDVKCTCDYTRGYDFITRPNNPCYCIPSEEDCSCYFNPCQMSGLQHDNRCINTTFNYKKNCLPFKNDSQEEETTSIDDHKEQTTETSSERDDLNVQVARHTQVPIWLVIAGIGLYVVAVIVILFKCKAVPQVLVELDRYTEATGKCIIIKCTVKSFPQHDDVYWKRKIGSDPAERIDTSTSKYSINTNINTPNLEINDVQESDEGYYICCAGNIIGLGQSTKVYLDVQKNDELNLEGIQNSAEIRYYIRVMIVGEHGVGKSCLLQRLLGKGIKEVESTDGIDIVIRKCKIRLEDGKWIFDEDQDLKRYYAGRIIQALKQKNVDSGHHDEKTEHREEKRKHQEEKPGVRLDTPDGQHSQYSTKKSGETLFELQSVVTATEQPTSSQPTNSLEQTRKVTKISTEKIEKEPNNFKSHIEPTNSSEQTRKVTRIVTEKIEKEPDNFVPHIEPTNSLEQTRKVTKRLTKKIEDELDDFRSNIEKYDKKNDAIKYVEISFWDFAGEKDYYRTHHTFLDSHALYLLVTDCSKEIKKTEPRVTYDSIGEYIDFWFNTIHNCRDVEDDNTGEDLNPPIIAVCTGLDKLPPKRVDEQKDSYRIKYEDVIQDEQRKKHLRETCFISNTNESLSDFNDVRKLIFDKGKELKSFEKKMQLKSIRLEQSLDVLRESGLHVITRVDVVDLAKNCGINEEEVEDFLLDQHKFGSIIYHSDIQDYVILSQTWLADVFKCLVSGKIDKDIKKDQEWINLLKTGILTYSFITKLFKKKQYIEFEDHILKVLMKFNIIGKYMEDGKDVYYMPDMIKQEWSPPLPEIILHFVPVMKEQNKVLKEQKKEFTRSPWLCLEFDFFPLAFFSYVMIYYIGKYKICYDSKRIKLAIYHGVGVFFLDDKQVNKFIVAFSKNTIAIQIWSWDQVAEDKYKEILSELLREIKSNINKYGARGLTCTVKGMCPEANIDDKSCRMRYKDLGEDKSYLCKCCKIKHDTCELLETWFYKYSDENLAKEKTVPPVTPSSAVSTEGISVPPEAPSSAVSTAGSSVPPEAPSSAVSTAGSSVPPEAPSSAVSTAGLSVPPGAEHNVNLHHVKSHIDKSSQIGQDIVKQQIEELALAQIPEDSSNIKEITRIISQETTKIKTKMAQETTEIKEHIDKRMKDIGQDIVKQQIEEKRRKLLENTENLIKTYTNENIFVHTNAANKALALVKENGIVILIGPPGIGKSCIGLELLRQISMDNKRHRSIQLDDISQWQDMSDDMDAVFIDDVFGRTNCIYNDNAHSKLLKMIYTTNQNKNVKVILTLRNNIYHTIATITERHRIFNDQHVLDLSLGKNQMTVKEKKSCLMNYLTKNKILKTDDIKKENINDNSILDTASTVYLHEDTLQKILHSDIGTQIGFPETCYLFATHRKFTKQGHNFFCHPTDNLLNEIKNLRKEGDTDKRKMIDFTLLVYILLNGDSVNIYEIDLGSFRTMMETMYFNPLANIPTSCINDSAEGLSGKYLKINNEGNYCFQHRLISEAVMISYSSTEPRRVIPLLGFDFITEMARHQRYRPGEGEVIFPVPVSCYSLLAQRLLQLLDTDYKRKPYLFVQNLCKSKIITMTDNTILQEMITQYKYKNSYHCLEFIDDHRFSYSYCVNTSYFYLPSALMMFYNIDNNSVYQCLYDSIHNTLTSESDSDVMEACKETLVQSFNFAVCTLDVKRSTVILKILTDHNIKQDDTPEYFCDNISRCQGLPGVQLMFSLHDLSHVFNITSLLSQIFRSFTCDKINIDDNMKQFITSVIVDNNHDRLPVRDIVGFVCEQGQLDFVKDVCERFDSSLLDVDYMIIGACEGSNTEVIQWLMEKYHGLYNVQRVLNDACSYGYIEGVRIILDKSDHTLLDMKTAMNIACSRGNTELVKGLCEKFDNNLFDMKTAMNNACSSHNTELVKWLCEKFDNNLFDMKTAMNNACSGLFNTELVKWLCEKFDNNLFDMKTAMNNACSSYNTELVKWLCEKFDNNLFDMKTAMNNACSSHNTELVKWLCEKFDNNLFDMKTAMNNACSSYNTELVKWLCEKFDNNLFDMKTAMNNACSSHNTELVKWLCEKFDNNLFDMKSVIMFS